MLMAKTAAELADALDVMEYQPPHNTGALAMLNEATRAFGGKSAELNEAQQLFSETVVAHKRSYEAGVDVDDAWRQAMQTAQRLATLLRALGDVRVTRQSGTE